MNGRYSSLCICATLPIRLLSLVLSEGGRLTGATFDKAKTGKSSDQTAVQCAQTHVRIHTLHVSPGDYMIRFELEIGVFSTYKELGKATITLKLQPYVDWNHSTC